MLTGLSTDLKTISQFHPRVKLPNHPLVFPHLHLSWTS